VFLNIFNSQKSFVVAVVTVICKLQYFESILSKQFLNFSRILVFFSHIGKLWRYDLYCK